VVVPRTGDAVVVRVVSAILPPLARISAKSAEKSSSRER
jgi:hypothetical protein